MIQEFLLLGIVYTKELKAGSQRDICTLMFIAALSTIDKRWKQPIRSFMDEWINNMWCIHAMGYHVALKKGDPVTCYNMDEPRGH